MTDILSDDELLNLVQHELNAKAPDIAKLPDVPFVQLQRDIRTKIALLQTVQADTTVGQAVTIVVDTYVKEKYQGLCYARYCETMRNQGIEPVNKSGFMRPHPLFKSTVYSLFREIEKRKIVPGCLVYKTNNPDTHFTVIKIFADGYLYLKDVNGKGQRYGMLDWHRVDDPETGS